MDETVLMLRENPGAVEKERAFLRERLDLLDLIFQGDQLAPYSWHVPSGELRFDARFHVMLGGQPGAAPGTIAAWLERVHPEDRARLQDTLDKHRDGIEKLTDIDYRVRHESGEWSWVRDRGKAVERDEAGRPMVVRGALRDIDARKRAEAALRESEERYRRITEAITDYIYTVRVEQGRAVETRHGPGCVAITGYSSEDFVADPFLWYHMVFTDDRPAVEEQARRVLAGENCGPLEHRLVRKDGSVRWVRNTPVPHRDAQNRLVTYDGLIEDVSERKLAEERLAAEKERLAVTLASIGDGVLATDTEGRVLLVNRVAEQLAGWTQEQALGHSIMEVLPVIDATTRQIVSDPIQKVLEEGRLVARAQRVILKGRNGTERWIERTGAPIRDQSGRIVGVVIVFADVTDRERLEQELLNTERLESIALLAGGIAHDFNNILTGILGYVSLAKNALPQGGKIHGWLEEAARAVMHARDLTHQLLTFSKGGAPVRRPTRLQSLLQEAVLFTMRGSSASVEFSLPENLWYAEVDCGQINQAVSNLVLNAIQAMPAGGKIRIQGENVLLEEDNPHPLPAGRYVSIAVIDTGVGIPRDHLDHVFDPYFTTKQKGSGLGLATTYSILKRHDGHIEAESRLGVGSTFTFFLPASDRPIEIQPTELPAPIRGQGRILVMDDEESLRQLVTEMLSGHGYAVECARHGAEAIEQVRLAESSGQPFAAAILDLTIRGGMGGRETADRIRAIAPKMKIIVSSGYSNDPVLAEFERFGFHGMLTKPYGVEALLDELKRLLGSAG